MLTLFRVGLWGPIRQIVDVFDRLTRKEIIFDVSELFYEKVYEHPWLSQYFKDVDQTFITQQQADFMVGALGGPRAFSGRLPSNAHPHMMITDELFDLREALLKDSLDELKAPEYLKEAWIRIDEAFRHVIVKKTKSECQPRYGNEPILDFESPYPQKKAA